MFAVRLPSNSYCSGIFILPFKGCECSKLVNGWKSSYIKRCECSKLVNGWNSSYSGIFILRECSKLVNNWMRVCLNKKKVCSEIQKSLPSLHISVSALQHCNIALASATLVNNMHGTRVFL